jgi:hypothetical protein
MPKNNKRGNNEETGILPHADGMLFHKLIPSLLWYMNEKYQMCSTIKTVQDVIIAGLDQRFQLLRNQVCEEGIFLHLFFSFLPVSVLSSNDKS